MLIAVVHNPRASGYTADFANSVQAKLSQLTDFEVVDLDISTVQAEVPKYSLALVLGGDGSINAVANALGDDSILLALPLGHTNVFTRNLGLSRNPGRALDQVALALAANRFAHIAVGQLHWRTETGEVKSRRFVSNAGVGLDAEVLRLLEDRRKAGPTTDRKVLGLVARQVRGSMPATTIYCVGRNWTYLGPLPLGPKNHPAHLSINSRRSAMLGALRLFLRKNWRPGLGPTGLTGQIQVDGEPLGLAWEICAEPAPIRLSSVSQ